jgi:hypothetical protein
MVKLFQILFLCSFVIVSAYAKDMTARRNAIKTTLLSWYTGSCKLSYERAVFNNQSMEVTAGYIGFGHDKFVNQPKGYTARYAHKFILFGNNIQPLNGFYLRPEFIYTNFHYDMKNNNSRGFSKMGSIVFTSGYQFALHRFVVDAFLGSGYAFGIEADTFYEHGFALWNLFGKQNKNIDLTFGIKLGVSF